MQEARVASRYAKSLLDLAVERGVVDDVQKDMALFAKICEENPQFERVMKNPIIPHFKKSAILHALLKGKMNDLSFAMFDLITKKTREGYLYFIAREYLDQYRSFKGIQTAVVTTVTTITEEQRANFVAIVKNLSGKNIVELQEKLDAELIGGYILNVGDRQIDQSVRTKLKVLKNKFSDNPYIAKY